MEKNSTASIAARCAAKWSATEKNDSRRDPDRFVEQFRLAQFHSVLVGKKSSFRFIHSSP
jgi:hypothetical protein